MKLKADPEWKCTQLKNTVAKLLQLDVSSLFPNGADHQALRKSGAQHHEHVVDDDSACLCLLNIGSAGFLAINQAQFDDIVRGFNPDTVLVSWMPQGRCFSFIVFKSVASAQSAYAHFHNRPCQTISFNNKPRVGLAAFPHKPALLESLSVPSWFRESLSIAANTVTQQQPASIHGLSLVDDFISESEERDLIDSILTDAQIPWIRINHRKVKHYGAAFQYKSRDLGPAPAVPLYLDRFTQRVLLSRAAGLPRNSNPPFQVTVSYYPLGTGIPSHVDIDELGTHIVSLSLHSGCYMDFKKVKESARPSGSPGPLIVGDKVHVYLKPRSLLSICDDARYHYAHGIKDRKSDLVDQCIVERSAFRVSIVWRIFN